MLGAFRQTEDAIATNRLLATQAAAQRTAAEAAARTSALALTRYRNGATDYLEVVIAQTDALDAQRETLALETQRMRSRVALVKAIGGF